MEKTLKVIYIPLCAEAGERGSALLREKEFDAELCEGDVDALRGIQNLTDRRCFETAISRGEQVNADLLLAEDGTRVVAAIREARGYAILGGGDLGALLTEYLLIREKKSLSANSKILRTTFTHDLGAVIAERHGISAEIVPMDGDDLALAFEKDPDAVFAYDESGIFLFDPDRREEIGLSAVVFICEMADHYKKQGFELHEILRSLRHRCGYFLAAEDRIACRSLGAAEELFDRLRKNADLFASERGELREESGFLLCYDFHNGSRIFVTYDPEGKAARFLYRVKAKDLRGANALLTAYSDMLFDLAE
ncbi:MAG: hypothetical protein IIY02_04455 [Firmicutes bacterium]|nr:hypothetical protein [Bacillota bacterium]